MASLKLKGKAGEKSKIRIRYHGRSGYPKIYRSSTGKRFIMVRETGGGTKRLYEHSYYKEND